MEPLEPGVHLRRMAVSVSLREDRLLRVASRLRSLGLDASRYSRKVHFQPLLKTG
jgi:hypothetical protein